MLKAKTRNRRVRVLAALALVGLAVAATWQFFGPVPVTVAHPTRGPAVEAVYGSGSVEPTVMFPIGPKVAGRLEKLLIDEGSTVHEGQVLAQLDDRELAALVVEWEARVRYREVQFRRADELFRNRTGTEAALDQARHELETAKASLERIRRQLAEMTLTAPGDGIIIRRDGEIGELIQPGEPIFWMACCGSLRVTAEIDEEDIRLVKPGQKVLMRADAFPDRIFEGGVAEITPKGDPVARSFRVRIHVPPDSDLMIGMTADVNVIVSERQDALLVPATAVVDGKIWLVDQGKLVQRGISVGVVGERVIEIASGVGERDLVVVHPSDDLREGRYARIVPWRER